MSTLPERLKMLRKSAGLKQKELGKIIGVAPNTVSQYETGKTEPNDDIKLAMADYFKVSMDYLLGKSNDPGLDSKTPSTLAAQITKEGIEAIHAYAALSEGNRRRVEDYIKVLSELERLGKNKED